MNTNLSYTVRLMFFQMAIQLIFTAQYFISSSRQSYEVIRSSFHHVQGGTLKELREKGPVCTHFLGEKWGKKRRGPLFQQAPFTSNFLNWYEPDRNMCPWILLHSSNNKKPRPPFSMGSNRQSLPTALDHGGRWTRFGRQVGAKMASWNHLHNHSYTLIGEPSFRGTFLQRHQFPHCFLPPLSSVSFHTLWISLSSKPCAGHLEVPEINESGFLTLGEKDTEIEHKVLRAVRCYTEALGKGYILLIFVAPTLTTSDSTKLRALYISWIMSRIPSDWLQALLCTYVGGGTVSDLNCSKLHLFPCTLYANIHQLHPRCTETNH